MVTQTSNLTTAIRWLINLITSAHAGFCLIRASFRYGPVKSADETAAMDQLVEHLLAASEISGLIPDDR